MISPERIEEAKRRQNQSPEEQALDLLATSHGRRVLSKADPTFFDTYYCGMVAAPHRSSWLNRVESERLEARRTGEKRKALFLAPRDHGKTELGISFATRAICMDRNIRILWVAEASAPAEKRVARVANLLRSEEVQKDWCDAPEQGFGPFDGPESKWKTTQIYVNRTKKSVDPTIEAVGAGGAVTGGHFDLIIFDDVETPERCNTAALRKATREWYSGTVLPMLTRGGMLLVIGTCKHADDLYANMQKDSTFEVIKDPALFYEEGGKRVPYVPAYDPIYETREDGRQKLKDIVVTDPRKDEVKALWPGWRDMKYLLSERQSNVAFGTVAVWNREYQHVVVDEETAAFPRQWLIRALNRGKRLSLYEYPKGVDTNGEYRNMPLELDVVQSWDLSLVTDAAKAEEKDRDFTVGITWGLDRATNDRYLLGMFRRRGMSPKELRAAVVHEYRRFCDMGLPPRSVAVERNNFGELHYFELADTTNLPLVPHLTTGTKKADSFQGVPGLRNLFDNNRVVIPSNGATTKDTVQVLVDELHELGKAKHDDTVMSLWIAESVLRPLTVGGVPLPRIGGYLKAKKSQEDADAPVKPAGMRSMDNVRVGQDGTITFSSRVR